MIGGGFEKWVDFNRDLLVFLVGLVFGIMDLLGMVG
jgi:hypothetical protein